MKTASRFVWVFLCLSLVGMKSIDARETRCHQHKKCKKFKKCNCIKIPNGPYLGQPPPGLEPEVFAPGIISLKNRYEYFVAFSPDGKQCMFGVTNAIWFWSEIYTMSQIKGRWTQPVKAEFLDNFDAWMPTFSPDGDRLFHVSARPWTAQETNIWVSGKDPNGGWNEPIKLGEPINTPTYEWCPSLTYQNVLYFASAQEGSYDIYRASLNQEPYHVERLSDVINTYYSESSVFISPDERFLTFESDRPGGFGQIDLYISFLKEDGTWTTPQNLGERINTFQIEDGGRISPDGKYFFFNRREAWITGVDTDLYWVDSRVVFMPYLKEPIQDVRVTPGTSLHYPIGSETFGDYDDDDDEELDFSASLSDGQPLPAWLSFDPESLTFSGQPTQPGILQVEVTAIDPIGSTTSDDFQIVVE